MPLLSSPLCRPLFELLEGIEERECYHEEHHEIDIVTVRVVAATRLCALFFNRDQHRIAAGRTVIIGDNEGQDMGTSGSRGIAKALRSRELRASLFPFIGDNSTIRVTSAAVQSHGGIDRDAGIGSGIGGGGVV